MTPGRDADGIVRVETLVRQAAEVVLTAHKFAHDFERFAETSNRRQAQRWLEQAEELRKIMAQKADYICRLAAD